MLAEDRGYLAWPDVDGGFAIALLLLSLVLLLAVVLLAIFTAALSVRACTTATSPGCGSC